MAEKEQFATVPLQIVTDVRVFQPFEGANHKRMQRLLTGRENGRKVDAIRLPISPKRLMESRLGRIGQEGDQNYLRSVYVDTSTAVLPNPNGEGDVRYSHEHPSIYRLTEKTKLVGGNLPIDEEQYASSEGFTLNKENAAKIRNNACALPNTRRAFWEFLAEGDTKLTADYVKDVETKLGMKFNNVMGLWLSRNKGLRLLGVCGVDDYGMSCADGSDYLDYYFGGRLVGEVAEPQSVAKKMGISLDTLVKE